MNRSLPNVLFGGIAQTQAQKKIEGEVTTTSVDETVDALANAENVIIVCVCIMRFLVSHL
jgi:NAD(P) transhydrogenase